MFPPVHVTSRATQRILWCFVSFSESVVFRRRRRRRKVRSNSRYPPSEQVRHSSMISFCTASNPQELFSLVLPILLLSSSSLLLSLFPPSPEDGASSTDVGELPSRVRHLVDPPPRRIPPTRPTAVDGKNRPWNHILLSSRSDVPPPGRGSWRKNCICVHVPNFCFAIRVAFRGFLAYIYILSPPVGLYYNIYNVEVA